MPEFNRRKFLIASAGAAPRQVLLGGVAAVTLPDLLREGQDNVRCRPTRASW